MKEHTAYLMVATYRQLPLSLEAVMDSNQTNYGTVNR